MKLASIRSLQLCLILLISAFYFVGCSKSPTPYNYGGRDKPVLTAAFDKSYTSDLDVTLQLSSTETAVVMVIAATEAECTSDVTNYSPFSSNVPVQISTPNASFSVWAKVRTTGRVWSDCVKATVVHDNLDPNSISDFQFQDRIANINTTPVLTWTNGTDVGPAGVEVYKAELKVFSSLANDYVTINSNLTAASGSTVDLGGSPLLVDDDYTFGIITRDFAGNESATITNPSSFSLGGTLHYLGTPSAPFYPETLAVGDINGDGSPDIVTGDFGSSDLYIYYNAADGRPNFTTSMVSLSHNGLKDLAVADLDADGDNDIIVASFYSDIVVWLESSGGATPTFTEHALAGTLLGPRSLDIADIDGDGDLDIVAGGSYDDQIVWYANDGAANFAQAVITTSAYFLSEVIAVDVNGDGNMDIAAASEGDDTLAWFESDGAGVPTFTRRVVSSTELHIQGLDAADINGDGSVDFVSAAWLSSTLSLHLSDGAATPSFTTSQLATLGSVRSTKIADMDGDGDNDIVAISSSGSLRLYANDGALAPTFTPVFITDQCSDAVMMRLIDMDGDADIDIVSLKKQSPVLIER